MTIKEWMSDAGGEYKSEAFLRTLKDAGIIIKQSAPHTPQQNGCAEYLMHILMDEAQAMHLEACYRGKVAGRLMGEFMHLELRRGR